MRDAGGLLSRTTADGRQLGREIGYTRRSQFCLGLSRDS
jgi:hypothetical protein